MKKLVFLLFLVFGMQIITNSTAYENSRLEMLNRISLLRISNSLNSHILGLPKNFYKHFKGNISNKLDIQMDLTRSGKSLYGSYIYEKANIPITISGEISDDGTFVLKEYSEGCCDKITGYFSGKFVSENKITGHWSNAQKNKKLTFDLSEDYTQCVKLDVFELSLSYKLLKVDSSPEYNLSLMYYYPLEFYNKEVLDKTKTIFEQNFFANNAVHDNPKISMENAKNSYLQVYKGMEQDFNSEMGWYVYNWETNINMGVVFNKNNLLCVSISGYEYTGGAHGNGGTSYFSIDMKTGNEIKESDIFIDKYDNLLDQLLLYKLMKNNGVTTKEELENIGFFTESIKHNGNFYFDQHGLGYLFNPYEIAPYVMGETEIFFTFEEIRSVLKANSPISHLFLKK